MLKSGSAIAGISAIGTASAKQTGQRANDAGDDRTETGGVGIQSLDNASASFSSWEISTMEDATFDCSWEIFLPLSFSAHRLDAHIEAAHIEQPEINAVDVGPNAIKKNWDCESVPWPPGITNPTYHFKIQKQFLGFPGSSQTVEFNSEIVPTSSGDVSAWVGGQAGGGNAGSGFVGAELEIL